MAKVIRLIPGIQRWDINSTTVSIPQRQFILDVVNPSGQIIPDDGGTTDVGPSRVGIVDYQTHAPAGSGFSLQCSLVLAEDLFGAQGAVFTGQGSVLWNSSNVALPLRLYESRWDDGGPGQFGRVDTYYTSADPAAGYAYAVPMVFDNLPASFNGVGTIVIPSPDYTDETVLYDQLMTAYADSWVSTSDAPWVWDDDPLIIEIAATPYIVDYDSTKDEGLVPNYVPGNTDSTGYGQYVSGHPADPSWDRSTGKPYFPYTLACSIFLLVGNGHYLGSTPPPVKTDHPLRFRHRDDGLVSGVFRAHATSRQRSIRQRGYL